MTQDETLRGAYEERRGGSVAVPRATHRVSDQGDPSSRHAGGRTGLSCVRVFWKTSDFSSDSSELQQGRGFNGPTAVADVRNSDQSNDIKLNNSNV